MKLLEKMRKKEKRVRDKYEQLRAERLRKKKKPDPLSHKGVILQGLMTGRKPWQVSRDIIEMRKTKRMMKNEGENKI